MNKPSPTSEPYVDAHVHIRAAAGIDDLVRAGIGAARDAGTRQGSAFGVRSQTVSGAVMVLTAGRALVKAGGYGELLGTPVAGKTEIEREIAGLAGSGADIIKVVASGIVSLRKPHTVTAGGFDEEELRFIVDVARRLGLGVMCHANGAGAINAAVEAGVRSIEHGFFMTEGALREMKGRGIFWVPTVGALRRAASAATPDQEMEHVVERTIDDHLAMINRAFSIGVPLAIGTDSVLPDRRYGGYYEEELAYFRKAGIPPDIVADMACAGGRKLLGAPPG